MVKIKKLLVANRSEIAIRVFRAANELGLQTVAVFAEEDKTALHRFKADEAYQVGKGLGPIEAYLSIPEIIRVAKQSGSDAIHPGYGFLSESPEFADACAAAGIIFVGPRSDTMRRLGNKVAARNLAIAVGVPVMPATEPLPDDLETVKQLAAGIGYPVMLKASWGGGGRGMRVIRDEAQLLRDVPAAKREAKAAFGKDEVYLEKLVERARHVEVQILGDRHGNVVHLFERDCSVQRRHQKVVERAPAPYLAEAERSELCGYAVAIAKETNYLAAGTVEFLMDVDTGKFYFIEVNPRIQVEHTVTEEVTGIDIVKAQIHLIEGETIGSPGSGVPPQAAIRLNGHALQCRITTEDPENKFVPDYGRITAYRGAMGFGIRLDGGTAYSGAVITRFYDPLLEKITAWAPTPQETIARMDRALARIPDSRRRDQSRLRRERHHPPEIPRQQLHHALHRRDARAHPPASPPRPRHQAADLHRRRHRQRPPRGARPRAAAEGFAEAGRAGVRRRRSCPAPSRSSTRTARRGWRTGCSTRSASWSPTPRCATATSRCSRHGCAATTWSRSPNPMPQVCRNCFRWNAGVARPSTSRCVSSPKTPGSGCRRSASGCRTSCCRCCCAAPTASATPTIPTTWCASSFARRRRAASTCSASSTR